MAILVDGTVEILKTNGTMKKKVSQGSESANH